MHPYFLRKAAFRTIYSNSESSEQFLKQNTFLTYSWRFLTLVTNRFQIGKNTRDLEIYRKSSKPIYLLHITYLPATNLKPFFPIHLCTIYL